MAKRTVAVCSNSLLLSVIGDHLQQAEGVNVIRFTPHLPDALAKLVSSRPDMVLVEHNPQARNAHLEHFIFELLQLAPGLPVVGLSTSQNELTILLSERIETGHLSDLLKVMNGLRARFGQGPQDGQSYNHVACATTIDRLHP